MRLRKAMRCGQRSNSSTAFLRNGYMEVVLDVSRSLQIGSGRGHNSHPIERGATGRVLGAMVAMFSEGAGTADLGYGSGASDGVGWVALIFLVSTALLASSSNARYDYESVP